VVENAHLLLTLAPLKQHICLNSGGKGSEGQGRVGDVEEKAWVKETELG
jgi:hypothetical protein